MVDLSNNNLGVAVPLVGFSSQWKYRIQCLPKFLVLQGGGCFGMGAMKRVVGALLYFGWGAVILCLGVWAEVAWAKDLGVGCLGLLPLVGTVVHGFSVGRVSMVEAGSSVTRCLPLSTRVRGLVSDERTKHILLSWPRVYTVCQNDLMCWSMQSRIIQEIFFIHPLVRRVGSLGGTGNNLLAPFGK